MRPLVLSRLTGLKAGAMPLDLVENLAVELVTQVKPIQVAHS